MEEQNEINEQENIIEDDNLIAEKDIETQSIISQTKFIILITFTFGLYTLWWIYKAWRFFQQKNNIDILPALRAIFSIIFLIPLLINIKKFALSVGYEKKYLSISLFLGFYGMQLFRILPFPYNMLALMGYFFLIPAFNAFNFALRNSENIKVRECEYFNGRQVVLIAIGSILWFFVIIGLIATYVNEI